MFREDMCIRCGDCLANCHFLDFDQETAVLEIEKLILGEESRVLPLCATCTSCNIRCEQGANPFDLILLRNEETGKMLPKEFADNFLTAPEKVETRIEKGDPDKGVISFCTVYNLFPRGVDTPLFAKMTKVSGWDFFCHMGLIHLGQKEMIKQGLERMIKTLSGLEAKEIVFLHDECYSALTKMAPQFGLSVPFQPVHLFAFLNRKLDAEKERIRPLNMEVAVQGACSTRVSPEVEEMADQIFAKIGVRRVQRTYERENGLCCTVPIYLRRPEKAGEIRQMNMDDARKNGADAIACYCPVCTRPLINDALDRDMDMYMVLDLVRMALGEKLPEPFFRSFDRKGFEARMEKRKNRG